MAVSAQKRRRVSTERLLAHCHVGLVEVAQPLSINAEGGVGDGEARFHSARGSRSGHLDAARGKTKRCRGALADALDGALNTLDDEDDL